ncbi:protein adenylyltransferase Fic [Gemella morbillorum]|uniref:protein adenylyltransferase Fic n=1 Tax=Gemella morbillorum TaxID=29391 RepID=UPI0023F211EC|nr:Fic family protein [Gemella morbillorum]
MVLQNKLGITESAKLAREEERISKIKAIELFNKNILVDKKAGTFDTLSYIHEFLFNDIYEFAGKVRVENIAKDNFRFAPVMYLNVALDNIDKMPQNTFEQIIEKYVEMNIAHPFREGNGRSMRLWLDHILKSELGKVVDWNKVDKEDYLLAMKRSPIRDIEIKHVLGSALTSEVDSREVFIKGLDTSYYYEGYAIFNAEDLDINNN